jgi:hypothetical protein
MEKPLQDELTALVREEIGQAPTPADVRCFQEALAYLAEATPSVDGTTFGWTGCRAGEMIEQARIEINDRIRFLERACLPLTVGDTIRVDLTTPAGLYCHDAKFLGLDDEGWIVLGIGGGRVHAPRLPEPGRGSMIAPEDRQRIETWLAERRAADRTTPSKRDAPPLESGNRKPLRREPKGGCGRR